MGRVRPVPLAGSGEAEETAGKEVIREFAFLKHRYYYTRKIRFLNDFLPNIKKTRETPEEFLATNEIEYCIGTELSSLFPYTYATNYLTVPKIPNNLPLS